MPSNRSQQAHWSQEISQEPIGVSTVEDDFTKFLELENDFTQFDDVGQQNTRSGLDTPMSRLAFGQPGHMQSLDDHNGDLLHHMDISLDQMSGEHLNQSYSSMADAQPFQQYPMYQGMQHSYHQHVPPTPVSAEMHGAKFGAALDQTSQIMFERQQASLTPLVSPAQTPLDDGWGMPDYVLADEFFSPLTSPAIEAQQSYASINATSSPVDLNVDQSMGDGSSKPNTKPRRKLNPTSRAAVATRTAQQTSGRKGQSTRRQPSLTSVPISRVDKTIRDATQSAKLQPSPGSAIANSDNSVSPEPSSETLMRPPPVPLGRSPTVAAKSSSYEKNAPVTPSTLMRIPGKQSVTSVLNEHNKHAVAHSDVMEDIVLPDAAAEMSTRSLSEVSSNIEEGHDQSTPTISAKTPKLSAESTPRSAGLKTGDNSQEAMSKQARGGRGNKKRQSVSSAAISPALRPKISPSISPLVPSTGQGVPIISAETSALYLASKSNYQNILDGTHLPGVSYPETLAENLSSKRTSHKIAEQGRRNRINLALKEIESLLPASITSPAGKKEKNGDKDENGENGDKSSAAQGASKASTVEMAIIYIKSLQAELDLTKQQLAAAEKKMTERSSSSESQDSV